MIPFFPDETFVNKWRESSHLSRKNRHGKRTHLQYNGFSRESPILQSRNHLSKAVDETSTNYRYAERNFGKRTETGFHLNDDSDDNSEQVDGNHAILSANTESNTLKPPEVEEEGGAFKIVSSQHTSAFILSLLQASDFTMDYSLEL